MKAMTKLTVGLLAAVCLAGGMAAVSADPLKSAHYQFEESTLGGVGTTNTQSANFQAADTAGILGLGDSASTNFQIEAGGTTTGDPALGFGVVSPNVSLGNFSTSTPAVATSSFEVSDYTSYGYAVQIIGNPPAYGSHTLTAISSPWTSQTGVEQFGINLVANTSPVSVGANPNWGQFGGGYAESSPNYATNGQYRYVSGDTIAYGPKSSGATIYTITYLVNVTSLTPGGQYSGAQTIICTATY